MLRASLASAAAPVLLALIVGAFHAVILDIWTVAFRSEPSAGLHWRRMVDQEQTRALLRQYLLDAFEAEYKEANDTWRAVEAKAQIALTVSGVFLAAAFAYVREVQSNSVGTILLTVALICLLGSVGFALFALRIRRVSSPPLGNFIEVGVADLCRDGGEITQETLARFTLDRVTEWREAIRSVADENASKATLVWWSYVLLVIALVPVAIFTFLRLL